MKINNNPLGLLFLWVYYINPLCLLFPWVYIISPFCLIVFPLVHNPLGLQYQSLGFIIPESNMVYYDVDHGPTWTCDKDCLNMKINHGQSCLL